MGKRSATFSQLGKPNPSVSNGSRAKKFNQGGADDFDLMTSRTPEVVKTRSTLKRVVTSTANTAAGWKDRMCESAAGREWPWMRQHLYFFPLRFTSGGRGQIYEDKMDQFKEQANSFVVPKLMRICIIYYMVILIVLAVSWGVDAHGSALWVPTMPIRVSFYVVFIVCQILFFICTQRSWTVPRTRYILLNLTCAAPVVWAMAVKFRIAATNDLSDPIGLQNYLNFVIYTDPIVVGATAIVIIALDVSIYSITRETFIYHVLFFILFTVERLMTDFLMPSNQRFLKAYISVANFSIVFVLGFACRWTNEFFQRGSVVQRVEVEKRIEVVRNIRKVRQGGGTKAPIEFFIENLQSVRNDILQVSDGYAMDEELTATLKSADEIFQSCLQIATAHNSLLSINRRERMTQDSLSESEQTEVKFDEMYKSRRDITPRIPPVSILKLPSPLPVESDSEDKTRKLDGSRAKTLARRISTKRQSEVVFTSDGKTYLPQLTLHQKLAASIGHDLGLRLTDSVDECDSILAEVGFLLLEPFLDQLDINETILLTFVSAVANTFSKTNPFQNSTHAAMVMHNSSAILRYFIQMTESLGYVENVAFLVASLCHDVAHPGRSNGFYERINHPMASCWCRGPLLEPCQSFITFAMLRVSPEVDIAQNLSSRQYLIFRKLTIDLMLATDIAQHFGFVSKLRIRRNSPAFNMVSDFDDQSMVLQAILKAADFSYTYMDWTVHLEFSLRFAEQCYQQGEDEMAFGLSVTPFCSRHEIGTFPSFQSGRIGLVVMPLMEELYSMELTSLLEMDTRTKLVLNKQRWDQMTQNGESVEIPEHIRRCRLPDLGWMNKTTAKIGRSLKAEHLFADATQVEVHAFKEEEMPLDVKPLPLDAHRTEPESARTPIEPKISSPRLFVSPATHN